MKYHATDCAMIDGQGLCTCGLLDAEAAETIETVRAEILAARGYLHNLLDSPPDPDLTLAAALAGAGEWAHDTWPDYA